jgi:protein-L-isoaspartate(D-aspartate) O-methyltransferase
VPRERFVPPTFADQAYENTALPIGHAQTISQPLIVGLMTQALTPGERVKVLEIGTGSGYQTAVLSQLFRRVYTIEWHRELSRQAEKLLYELGFHNITFKAGDGTLGWPEQAPFQRIIVTAAAAEMPSEMCDQLAEGGIMVVPIGRNPIDQWIVRVTRNSAGFSEERLAPVRFVPLVAGKAPDHETW